MHSAGKVQWLECAVWALNLTREVRVHGSLCLIYLTHPVAREAEVEDTVFVGVAGARVFAMGEEEVEDRECS